MDAGGRILHLLVREGCHFKIRLEKVRKLNGSPGENIDM